MPLKRFQCSACGRVKDTLKNTIPMCDHGVEGPEDSITPPHEMKQILVAPSSKMMEKSDVFKGKSRQKDLNKILKERTRNYARDHEADDMISLNERNSITRSGFLGKDGKRRKKVDDL